MRQAVISYMISFAIGGLLGDVFFHTLPHLSSGHSHKDDHDHQEQHGGHAHDPEQMVNNLIIIAGIVSFFLIEKIVSNYLGED
jgi:hypothetical protein